MQIYEWILLLINNDIGPLYADRYYYNDIETNDDYKDIGMDRR